MLREGQGNKELTKLLLSSWKQKSHYTEITTYVFHYNSFTEDKPFWQGLSKQEIGPSKKYGGFSSAESCCFPAAPHRHQQRHNNQIPLQMEQHHKKSTT